MDAPSPALSLQPQAHGKAPLFLPAWSSWSSFASMGDEGFHDREAFISMSFLPIFQERLSCLGGPEAAGQAWEGVVMGGMVGKGPPSHACAGQKV